MLSPPSPHHNHLFRPSRLSDQFSIDLTKSRHNVIVIQSRLAEVIAYNLQVPFSSYVYSLAIEKTITLCLDLASIELGTMTFRSLGHG